MIRVAIHNNYLATFGGGEKNTYDIASCLAALGCEVDVLTFEDRPPSIAEVEAFYGAGHGGFSIESLSPAPPDQAARDAVLTKRLESYSVFINHCASSSFTNPCPIGIYLVMFPFQPAGPYLRSYQHFLCISRYTEFYTRLRWGADLSTPLLYPCAADLTASDEGPRSEVLAIGRFNWAGHQKNQDLLVDAFEDILDLLPRGWVLTLLGKVNASTENLGHLDRLKRRCRRLPVRFELDASEKAKQAALGRAAVFWHGTGLGRTEPGEAASMEHFGIAVVEAMSAGAVPLCYDRGGPREIVRNGESGFLVRDVGELGMYTTLLAAHPRLRERMSASAQERAAAFSRQAFDEQLTGFFRSVVAA